MGTEFFDYVDRQQQNTPKVRDQATLRPTLYIGLGGFGCTVVRRLKKQIAGAVSKDALSGFAFVGLDTHPYEAADDLTRTEYLPLSVGVNPSAVAAQDKRDKGGHLDWYEDVMNGFPAGNISGGANQLKPVGRLAFRNVPVFTQFINMLTGVSNQLRTFRDEFRHGESPLKVYIISSLAGGTGSGCLVDVMAVTGKFFREVSGADFPYQAIIAAPDSLEGKAANVSLPALYANCYATLKELYNFYNSTKSVFQSYDDGTFRELEVKQEILPTVLHLVSNSNESGDLVAKDLEAVGCLVSDYLMSEIQTPLNSQNGTPKIQDCENQLAGSRGEHDSPQCFSSFGVVTAGLPREQTTEYLIYKLATATLRAELTEPTGLVERASKWVHSHRIAETEANDLQDLVREKILDQLHAASDASAILLEKGQKSEDLVQRASTMVDEYRKTLELEKKPIIDGQSNRVAGEVKQAITDEFGRLLKDATLCEALGFIRALKAAIQGHQASLREETTEVSDNLTKTLGAGVKESIADIEQALAGSFFSKGKRVAAAVSDFEIRLDAALASYIALWIEQRSDSVYAAALDTIATLLGSWENAEGALQGHLSSIKQKLGKAGQKLDQMSNVQKREGSRYSLIDARKADTIYDTMLAAQEGAIARATRAEWLEKGRLADSKSNTEAWLWHKVENGNDSGYDGAAVILVQDRINPVLEKFTFNRIVEEFYKDRQEKAKLIDTLTQLSEPLFFIDPNLRETGYYDYWIVAMREDQRQKFGELIGSLPGQSTTWALSNSTSEVTFYQLRMGYTALSYNKLRTYKNHYDRFESEYLGHREGGKKVRPLHCWKEALEWDDIDAGGTTDNETLELYSLGRALDRFFPGVNGASADDAGAASSSAFIFQRGCEYFLQPDESYEEPVLLGGKALEVISKLESHQDLKQLLKTRVEWKKREVGEQALGIRLEQEYLPVLHRYIEESRKKSDVGEALLAGKLVNAVTHYIEATKPKAL